MSNASVWSISSGHAVTKWYTDTRPRNTAAAMRPPSSNTSAPPAHSTARIAYIVPGIRRRRVDGKRYGPTYAVTSRSSGRTSGACSGGTPLSLTSGTLRGPCGAQLVVARAQALREYAGFGHRGHEVGVAAPPRQGVHVHVARDSRAGGTSDVHAHVHPLG